jgi:hypothetical protein
MGPLMSGLVEEEPHREEVDYFNQAQEAESQAETHNSTQVCYWNKKYLKYNI